MLIKTYKLYKDIFYVEGVWCDSLCTPWKISSFSTINYNPNILYNKIVIGIEI